MLRSDDVAEGSCDQGEVRRTLASPATERNPRAYTSKLKVSHRRAVHVGRIHRWGLMGRSTKLTSVCMVSKSGPELDPPAPVAPPPRALTELPKLKAIFAAVLLALARGTRSSQGRRLHQAGGACVCVCGRLVKLVVVGAGRQLLRRRAVGSAVCAFFFRRIHFHFRGIASKAKANSQKCTGDG